MGEVVQKERAMEQERSANARERGDARLHGVPTPGGEEGGGGAPCQMLPEDSQLFLHGCA